MASCIRVHRADSMAASRSRHLTGEAWIGVILVLLKIMASSKLLEHFRRMLALALCSCGTPRKVNQKIEVCCRFSSCFKLLSATSLPSTSSRSRFYVKSLPLCVSGHETA